MAFDPCGHGGRLAFERLVPAREVVVHEVQRHRVRVVLDLLGEPVGQARSEIASFAVEFGAALLSHPCANMCS